MSKTAELLKRVAALEAVVAGVGHNGAFLDDDEPPKRKPALIPDRDVARRYGVSVRTVERWDAVPGLGFPPAAIYIRHRRYRSVKALDQWDRDRARRVADPYTTTCSTSRRPCPDPAPALDASPSPSKPDEQVS